MAKSRQKKPRRIAAYSKVINSPTVESSVTQSLPLASPETALDPPALMPAYDITKESWYLPPDSVVRVKAMHMVACRLAGMDDEEIGKALNVSPKSIGPYIYRANKNGWLTNQHTSLRGEVENDLLYTAVSNLRTMLSDDTVLDKGQRVVKQEATMELLKGTMFKSFDQVAAPTVAAQNVVSLQIVMPTGPVQQMREDTTGGVPAYIDAEPVK